MVVIDFFNLNTRFPVGQDPLSTVSDEITSPGDTEEIKFSVGYDRLAVFVPFILGCVVPRAVVRSSDRDGLVGRNPSQ